MTWLGSQGWKLHLTSYTSFIPSQPGTCSYLYSFTAEFRQASCHRQFSSFII